MRSRLAILPAALAIFCFNAMAQPVAPDPDAAEALAERFCAARLADDEDATRALLSSNLVALIEEAEGRNASVAASTPDEKPPLGDGVPYQAFPDPGEVCEVGAHAARGGRSFVPVTYRFPDRAGADWSDRLLIVVEEGDARIDDVHYPRFTTDSVEYGLRRALRSMFDLR